MGLKEILIEINEDVKDIVNMGFELTNTQSNYVPHFDDPGLTFERGKVKKAKIIETCILYADIRNSSELTKTLAKDVMAKVYTAFVKSTLIIAEYHGGLVRNIIGDRVMIVFPTKNCFKNAIETAISINTVANKIISQQFKSFEFKVGIGIDFGQKKVIKIGIPKHDKENYTYKGLVWVGTSANIASKLTDIANKTLKRKDYHLTLNLRNPNYGNSKPNALAALLSKQRNQIYLPPIDTVEYFEEISSIQLTSDEFYESLISHNNGILVIKQGKVIKIEKREVNINIPPILISQKVWQELKKEEPNHSVVANNQFTAQNIKIREFTGQVLGCDLIWSLANQIKF